eukprot:300314-Amphidinium_carterae.2
MKLDIAHAWVDRLTALAPTLEVSSSELLMFPFPKADETLKKTHQTNNVPKNTPQHTRNLLTLGALLRNRRGDNTQWLQLTWTAQTAPVPCACSSSIGSEQLPAQCMCAV